MASSSTFDLARSTAQWANEIDPQFKIQAEDLQALCGGSSQLRKMLTWCQASLRNKSKIRAVLRNRQQQAEVVKVEELARLRKEQDAKLDELQALLSKQRELKGSIKKALESIRKIEGKTDRESDEFAAQLTRHQIFLQLADKREKDLKLWADTYIELCNDAPFQELENNIIDMKKISNEALETASSAVVACSAEKAAKPTAVAAKVPDNPHSRAGSAGTPLNAGLMAAGTYKQTEAEVQAHILREYLSACAVMHSVNSKHAEKMLVAEEAKDHFKIALAIEVALAEKACLRTLMTEIEGDVLQVSSGPMELQRQKVRSLQLNNRAAKIKKVIASQARKNVQLDRRLEEVNGFIFDGATLPAQLSSSTLVLDESAIHHPSSLPADPSHGAHGDRHEGEGEGYGGSLCDLLDAEIGELCGAVSAVSGCWLAQSQVLARIPVSALRRIVPERSAVHFDPSDGAGVAISLPVPVEDYASQQAADGSSLVSSPTALGSLVDWFWMVWMVGCDVGCDMVQHSVCVIVSLLITACHYYDHCQTLHVYQTYYCPSITAYYCMACHCRLTRPLPSPPITTTTPTVIPYPPPGHSFDWSPLNWEFPPPSPPKHLSKSQQPSEKTCLVFMQLTM